MRLSIWCVAATLLAGCAANEELPQTGIKSVSWLAGRWMSQDSMGQFIEEWRDMGDHMLGQGRIVTGTDTINMEQLRIVNDSTGLVYIVTLGSREIRFNSQGQTETEAYKNMSYNESVSITFKSDTNDFPREINYRKQNSDSLYIRLTGTEAGKPMDMMFKMKKL
jgi:hypothetical protein